ncbi:MAG: type II toxin-antitoxin system RelE family toxin [Rhizobiaceae bacterium]
MTKEISYSKDAFRTLRKIPRNEATRIMEKVAQYAADPSSLGNNVKALAGLNLIRLRVGDWRILMDDQGVVLIVVKVGPRGSVYE